jgi:hypothetical protein
MEPYKMKQIINGKLYNTETATLLSGDDWWDGNNFERSCTNTFLYRTKKGAYFTQNLSQWQGSCEMLEAISQEEAIELFEYHSAHGENRVEFEEAFPGVEVEEA